jgi:ribose transport system ATP-binding protein
MQDARPPDEAPSPTAATTAAAPLLRMSGIVKRFPGVVALDGVSLELDRGEVLALMGENGAGKSTLMKILGGAYRPDGGEILVDGRPAEIGSVRDAKRLGIALIHQELMLARNLDVAGNVFLGNEPGAGPALRPLPRGRMREAAAALLRRVGLNIPPSTPVRRLTAGQMQMVEIAKALALDARIIIMDEPTSSLTIGESQHLFTIIEELRRSGIGLVYISHRMEEVLRVSDRITVLRDGRRVGDLSSAEATHDKVASMMVGRAFSAWFPPRPERAGGEIALEVDELLVPGAPAGVSFTARRGEILGFAGLVGSGRTELMQSLFGVTPALRGVIRLGGERFAPRRPADAIRRGVYLAPEDRKQHGLVLPMSVAQNMTLPSISRFRPRWLLQRGQARRLAEAEVQRLRLRCSGLHQAVVNLSGGNQQKVVLGKWLAMRPRVLIADEPTRGVDVGAKAEIYRHLAALTEQGVTILMVSSDMEEVIGMSDRVVVMHNRRITGVLPRSALTEGAVVSLMTGAPGGAAAVRATGQGPRESLTPSRPNPPNP